MTMILGTDGDDGFGAGELNGGNGDDQLFGLAGNDVLLSAAGNDLLDGGTGADFMQGDAGNDTYIVDNSGDSVNEFSSTVTGGVDTVESSIEFTLPTNVENLTLKGSSTLNGTGNNLDNLLIGNAGNNFLDGGIGNDTLKGGSGNDVLLGGSGSNTLDGGSGTLDLLFEFGNFDFKLTPTSLKFGTNVDTFVGIERVELQGENNDDIFDASTFTGEVTLSAFGGNDTLQGGSKNDNLAGGSGNDRLTGGAGNDSFDGGLELDQIIESGNVNFTLTNTSLTGNGTDTVKNIEAATLNGGSSNNTIDTTQFGGGVTLKGEAGNDTLKSGKGNDNLDGGSGDDVMQGGDGIDVYTVNSSNDKVVETSVTGGLDFVNSSATFTLSTNVENLTLLGTSNINGTGNSLNNKITGNGFNNTLKGDGGSDTLLGGAGNDKLVGGAGNDTLTGQQGIDRFTFDTGNAFSTVSLGVDSITDFFLSTDKIVLDKQTFTALKSIAGDGFSVTSEFLIVGSDAAAATSGAVITYSPSTGGLFYDQNGTAAGFGTGGKFASVNANTSLNSTGFVIQA